MVHPRASKNVSWRDFVRHQEAIRSNRVNKRSKKKHDRKIVGGILCRCCSWPRKKALFQVRFSYFRGKADSTERTGSRKKRHVPAWERFVIAEEIRCPVDGMQDVVNRATLQTGMMIMNKQYH
jgi:hypothetical protein